jgi:hypothetical protein
LSNEDLLQPTLSEFRKPPSLYNSTGFFLSSFFGGPLGAGIYALANSYRLGRLASDLPAVIVIVAAAFLALTELNGSGLLQEMATFLGGSVSRNMEIFLRAFGMVCFAAIYFMHRMFFRAARVSGVAPRPGWVPGIVAVVVGVAANIAFTAWIAHH